MQLKTPTMYRQKWSCTGKGSYSMEWRAEFSAQVARPRIHQSQAWRPRGRGARAPVDRCNTTRLRTVNVLAAKEISFSCSIDTINGISPGCLLFAKDQAVTASALQNDKRSVRYVATYTYMLLTWSGASLSDEELSSVYIQSHHYENTRRSSWTTASFRACTSDPLSHPTARKTIAKM